MSKEPKVSNTRVSIKRVPLYRKVSRVTFLTASKVLSSLLQHTKILRIPLNIPSCIVDAALFHVLVTAGFFDNLCIEPTCAKV